MITDEIIEKIKKAVRLANRTNEAGERETAMNLAKQLAEKYGVSFESIMMDKTEASKTVCHMDTRMTAYDADITGATCGIVREHFGVVVVIGRVPRSTKIVLTWFGTSINIDVAQYVYVILHREADKAWQAVKDMGISRKQFMAGFFFEIHKKLLAHPLRNDSEQFLSEKKQAEKLFEKFKEKSEGNLKDKKVNKGKVKDVEALMAGMHAGKNVSLNRPCENSQGSSKTRNKVRGANGYITAR